MSDVILKVEKGIQFDPRKIKKDIKQLQQKIQEDIAEAVRLELSGLLQRVRKAQSARLAQLREAGYFSFGSTVNNPFQGAQARKRKAGTSWIVYVTRGSQDKDRNIHGGLFNLLDHGVKAQDGISPMRSFPVFKPDHRFRRGSLEIGAPVKLQTRRLKNGKKVPLWARTNSIKGFEGYKFYERAVKTVKKKLLGKVIVEGTIQYTITKDDFKTFIVFEDIKVDE